MSITVTADMLKEYNKNSPYNRIEPIDTKADETDKFGTWSYANMYDALYDKFSSYNNFNINMWREAIQAGEQDQYLSLLEQNKDNTLSQGFYDPAYYDYERMMLELYKPLADNTKKEERFGKEYDIVTNTWVDKSIGEMTEQEFIQYQIQQADLMRAQDIEKELEKSRKEQMRFGEKFGHSIAATLGEFGEGILSSITGALDFIGAVGTGGLIPYATSGFKGNYLDAFVNYFGQESLTAMEKESVRAALDEYERTHTLIRDIDGNMVGVGKYFANISNSIGMMVPSILLAKATGGTSLSWVGQGTFYASIFSNNMYENATNPYLVDSPSINKILNAAVKTGVELVIEYGLNRVLGGTIQNKLMGIGGGNIAKNVTKIATKGAGVKYLLKSAAQEGLEEFLQDFSTNLIDKFMDLYDEGYGNNGVTIQTLIDSFVTGALSSIFLSSAKVSLNATKSYIQNRKVEGSGDIVVEMKPGEFEKVKGFSRLYLENVLSDFQQAVDDLKKRGIKNDADLDLAKEVYAGVTALSQLYSSFDAQRIKNCEMLLNMVIEARDSEVKYQGGDLKTRQAMKYVTKAYREEVKDASVSFAQQVQNTVRDMIKDVNAKYLKHIAEAVAKNEKVLKENGVKDIKSVTHKDEKTGNSKTYRQKKESTRSKKSLSDFLAKSKDVEALERTLDSADTPKVNVNTSNTNDTADDVATKNLDRILEELNKDYQWIFTTDGHIAVEEGDILFVPEAWLENYKISDIYKFLEQTKAINAILADKTMESMLNELVKYDKMFTDRDNVTREQALMDFLFNESIYQGFLLSNNGANFHKFTSFIFRIHEMIRLRAEKKIMEDKRLTEKTRAARKNYLYNDIYVRMKKAMRTGTLKAILNWNIAPQDVGADLVLNEDDLRYVNIYQTRKRLLKEGVKTGKVTMAYRNVVEDILREGQFNEEELDIINTGLRDDASDHERLLAVALLDAADDAMTVLDFDRTAKGYSAGAFVMPPEAFLGVDERADFIQYKADKLNEFEQMYGISASDLYNENVSNLSENSLKKIWRDIFFYGNMTNFKQFVIHKLEQMLGSNYIVVPQDKGDGFVITGKISAEDLLVSSLIPDSGEDIATVTSVNDGKNNVLNFIPNDIANPITGEIYNSTLYNTIRVYHGVTAFGTRDLGDFLKYREYSEKLKDWTVITCDFGADRKGAEASTIRSAKIIYINRNGVDVLHNLVHEINHALQHEYGLARGFSPKYVKDFDGFRDDVIKYLEPVINYRLRRFGGTLQQCIDYQAYRLIQGELSAEIYMHNKNAHGYSIIDESFIQSFDNAEKFYKSNKSDASPAHIQLSEKLTLNESAKKPDKIQNYNEFERTFVRLFEMQSEFARYGYSYNPDIRNTYHSGLTRDTRDVVLSMLKPGLSTFVTVTATINDVIMNPEMYLNDKLLADLKGNTDEGNVFYRLKEYVENNFKGISIDRNADTNRYILVNDNAFDDLLTFDMLKKSVQNDTTLYEEYGGKEVGINRFYKLKELMFLGIDSSVKVIIDPNVKSETIIERGKNIRIYIRANNSTPDSMIIDKINHEFRHVLQHYNKLEHGFTPDFKVTPELLADIKAHAPLIFKNTELRETAKRAGAKNVDEFIAQRYVYMLNGAELNAQGIRAELLETKPTYVKVEAGKPRIFLPWYDANTGKGSYVTEFLAMRADDNNSMPSKKSIDDRKALEDKRLVDENMTNVPREDMIRELYDAYHKDLLEANASAMNMPIKGIAMRLALAKKLRDIKTQITKKLKSLRNMPIDELKRTYVDFKVAMATAKAKADAESESTIKTKALAEIEKARAAKAEAKAEIKIAEAEKAKADAIIAEAEKTKAEAVIAEAESKKAMATAKRESTKAMLEVERRKAGVKVETEKEKRERRKAERIERAEKAADEEANAKIKESLLTADKVDLAREELAREVTKAYYYRLMNTKGAAFNKLSKDEQKAIRSQVADKYAASMKLPIDELKREYVTIRNAIIVKQIRTEARSKIPVFIEVEKARKYMERKQLTKENEKGDVVHAGYTYKYKNDRFFSLKKAKGTNLMYFYVPRKQNQMDPDLQNFVIATTGHLDELPPKLALSITERKLTMQRFIDWFKTVDLKEINQFTFDLIRKHIFKNEYIKDVQTLIRLVNDPIVMMDLWAASIVLKREGYPIKSLIEQNNFDKFMGFLNAVRSSELKEKIVEKRNEYDKMLVVDDRGDKHYEVVQINQGFVEQRSRVLIMQWFDGSLASAFYGANKLRKALARHFEESFDRIGDRAVHLEDKVDSGEDTDKTIGDTLSNENTTTIQLSGRNTANDLELLYESVQASDGSVGLDEMLEVLMSVYSDYVVKKYKLDLNKNRHYEFLKREAAKFLEKSKTWSPEKIAQQYMKYKNEELLGDSGVDESKERRVNVVKRIKNKGERIITFINDRKINFDDLPDDVKNMFEVVELTNEKGVKATGYSLKPEVYSVGRGRVPLSKLKSYARTNYVRKADIRKEQNYAHDITKILENDRRLTEVVEAIKKVVKAEELKRDVIAKGVKKLNKRSKKAQERLNARLAIKMNADKGLKTTNVRVRRKKENVATGVPNTFSIVSSKDMPAVFRDILNVSFENMADTKVQFASKDEAGNLYDPKTSKDFDSRLRHEVTSWRAFYEANRAKLNSLTRDEAFEIIDFIKQGAAVLNGPAAKYAAFEIFTLGFIIDAARKNFNDWNFSDSEINDVEKIYEVKASTYGSGLRAVGQMIEVINPLKSIQQRMLEDYGVTEDELKPLFEAVENMQEADTVEGRKKAGANVQDEIERVENTILSRQVKAERGSKEWFKRVFEKGKSLRYMFMLSSPITWIRNKVSNVVLYGMNKSADKIGSLIFSKKEYRDDQWNLQGVKVAPEVQRFIETEIENNPLFESFYEMSSRYDSNSRKSDDDSKIAAEKTLFIQMIIDSIRRQHAIKNRFDSKTMKLISSFINKQISDRKFIKFAAKKYFAKILTIESAKGNISLENGVFSDDVLNLFAESVILANRDYVHKRSFLSEMMDSLRKHNEVAYEFLSFWQPFYNSSFNWYGELLKLTPIGLVKAIKDMITLERQIKKVEALRESARRERKPFDIYSHKAVEYLVRRDIGKGIIGTILLGVGALLLVTGLMRYDDDDDKFYVGTEEIKVDISNIFGTSSLFVGAAIAKFALDTINDDGSDPDAVWNGLRDMMGQTFEYLAEGFVMSDMFTRHKYDQDFYDFVLTETENAMKSFTPQFVQFFVSLTSNDKIKYSSGLKGVIERWLNAALPTQPLGDRVINPYTGETESKYAIFGLGEALKRGIFGPRIYMHTLSEEERMCRELGVNKGQLTGDITSGDKKYKLENVENLNIKYGELNKESLSKIKSQRHNVEMPDGKYKLLPWDDMSDKQKANVLERTFSHNAQIAKIYIWTQEMNHKYYASTSLLQELKTLGITRNVYVGGKGFVE